MDVNIVQTPYSIIVVIFPVRVQLFGDTNITYFCTIIIKDKYIAGLDVGVDDGGISLQVEELKPFCELTAIFTRCTHDRVGTGWFLTPF